MVYVMDAANVCICTYGIHSIDIVVTVGLRYLLLLAQSLLPFSRLVCHVQHGLPFPYVVD